MYAGVLTNRKRFAKPLALGLAVLALVFFLQIAGHGHNDSRQDSACRVCQLAHVGVGPAVAAVALTAPLVLVGHVATPVLEAVAQVPVSHSSPRAPPSPKA
jgi:hypothetical protein